MPNNGPLIVPIQVQALVVNDQPQNFRRWTMNYAAADYFLSPEAEPFSANQNDFKTLPYGVNEGVYLHWQLPDALRHGTQNADGVIQFSLVPNRWLVVRYFSPSATAVSRQATAWVIESDYLNPTNGSCPYIDPTQPASADSTTYAPVYTRTLIGRQISLAQQTWHETGVNAMFLQAVAPANALFASYQPHVQNVFSLHDDYELLNQQQYAQGVLSYLVLGWYSDTSQDPLATAQADGATYAEALAALQWAVTGDETGTTQKTIYQGMALGVNWQKTGSLPASARDQIAPSVAVGNTSIDAFTAWLRASDPSLQTNYPLADPQWLEAMQYDLLPEYNQPDGAAVVDQAIHRAWFGASPGGRQWSLVNQSGDGNDDLPPPLSPGEKTWLDDLNRNQQALDQLLWQLSAAQQQLFEMWWKNGYAAGYAKLFGNYPCNFAAAEFFQQLDPGNGALPSLTIQVYALMNQIAQLRAQVPNPAPGQTMDDAIQAFTHAAIAAGSIDATRQLRVLTKPNFWQATDPVILIAGINHSQSIDPYLNLPCRYADQLVTSIQINYQGTEIVTAAQVKSFLPGFNSSGVASVINALLEDKSAVPGGDLLTALLTEFFLLDPANAGIIGNHILHNTPVSAIADSISGLRQQYDQQIEAGETPTEVRGTLPAWYEPTWSQPWQPLFLEWEVYWYPLPFEQNGEANWTFNGSEYECLPLKPLPAPQVITGRSILTPKTGFDMKSRLEQYARNNPDDQTAQQLIDAIGSINGWDFLSQTLTGFSAQAAWRDEMSNLSPDDTQALYTVPMAGGQQVAVTMADLIGDAHHATPQSLRVRALPREAAPETAFEGMRCGRFYFRRLMLVDQFGQTAEIVTDSTCESFVPICAPGVLPDQPLLTPEPERFVELPPRLLQPARLDCCYVSPTDDSQELWLNCGVNPIAGWVLANHLDGGLAVYDPDGAGLGELRPVTNASGTQTVVWQAAPNAGYQTFSALSGAYPHLGAMLTALQQQSAEEFRHFLASIDETLWTIDPLNERYDQRLSVLVGRPLALLRARVRFELQQQPLGDPSWPFTFDPLPPPFINYEFPVRLGDQDHYRDGLLGYFAGNDYTVFNAVHCSSENASFTRKIQPGNFLSLKFDGQAQAFVTLLADPRAGVFAQTALLPVAELTLEPRYVDAALARMAIAVRTGPQLMTTSTVVAQGDLSGDTRAVLLPRPKVRQGVWTWMEKQGSEWIEMPTAASDQTASLSSVMPTLREGLLTLKDALTEEE